MTDALIAARLIEALSDAAAREANGTITSLVSVNIEMIAPASSGEARAAVTRRTKTLAFVNAEYIGESGIRIATASSVHKILA